MKELVGSINALKSRLDELCPLSEHDENRLWQKLRLLWNYNSNHIEGNTLTYSQTALLFKLGNEFRPENSPLKDVLEMKAHDVAVHLIKSNANDLNFKLSEKFIRELNEMILVEEYVKEAVTLDGQKTSKTIKPGKYKQLPNHVRLPSGEIFNYAESGDVTADMQSLMEWYRKDDGHPVIKAVALHYKFIIIHPFDDGNGRTARLLMNYHLMKEGYPPIIINSDDKTNYLYALRQADSGDLDSFVEYIAQQLELSLELAIKAAKGEEIDEPEDIDKKLSLIKQKIDSISKNAPLKTVDRMKALLNNDIFPAFEKYVDRFKRFDDVMNSSQTYLSCDITFDSKLDLVQRQELIVRSIDSNNPISRVLQLFKYYGIKKTAIQFVMEFNILIAFNDDHYYFENTLTKKNFRNNYNINLSTEEIESDILNTEKIILQKIEEAVQD